MNCYSTEQTLPDINEISAARSIVAEHKASCPASTQKHKQEDSIVGDTNDETKEPARKKGAVDTALQTANEIGLRALMMN